LIRRESYSEQPPKVIPVALLAQSQSADAELSAATAKRFETVPHYRRLKMQLDDPAANGKAKTHFLS
jgi:hypothetical protein